MMLLFSQAADSAYFFCTDFMINSANLLGWTYVDTNSVLLLIVFPLTPIFLAGVAIWQGRRLREWQMHSTTLGVRGDGNAEPPPNYVE